LNIDLSDQSVKLQKRAAAKGYSGTSSTLTEGAMTRTHFPYFYGQEQKVIESSPFKRAVTALFGATHLGERSRHQQLMKAIRLLPPLGKASVLNAGSASGAHSFYLEKRFPHWEILGIERDKKRVEDALKIKRAYRFSNVDFIAGDLREIQYENRFDLIFSISVLNYIEDEGAVMASFYRALKPEGYLILNVPSPPKRPILTFLQKEIERQNGREAIGIPLLESKRYANDEMQHIAARAGFKTLTLCNPCGLPSQLAWEISCSLEEHPLPKVLFRPFLLALVFLDRFGKSRPYPANVDCLFIGKKEEGNGPEAWRPCDTSFTHCFSARSPF
jgi:SAM-dependent methyltransferase